MTQIKSFPLWLKILSVIWIIWIFLDYWFKHPLYANAFGESYGGIVVAHVLVLAVSFVCIKKWSPGGISLLTMCICFFSLLWVGTLVNLTMFSDVEFTMMSLFGYLGRTIWFVLVVAIILWSAYETGRYIIERLLGIEQPAHSVSIALGLCGFVAVTFVLLMVGAFSIWTLIPMTLLPLFLLYRRSFRTLMSMNQPLPGLQNLSNVATGSILLVLLMNAITFGYTLSPFPVGFDALNYYINLPKLLAESDHLLYGFQPYNWSIIQAAGIEMTGRIEMALILSWAGLLLVQWVILEIGQKVMKLPDELVLLGVLMFTYMPAVSTQASQELKVDLALTYILLTMVLASFRLIKMINEGEKRKSQYMMAAIIGVLGGFALGIKLTAVIALFAIVGILWNKLLGSKGLIGVFLVCFALIFFAQMDTKAGLRAYHDSVSWLKYLSAAGGLALILLSVLKNTKSAKLAITLTVLMTVASVFTFAPWVVKNLVEIDSPSFTELINGTSHGPKFNVKTIDRNLKRSGQ